MMSYKQWFALLAIYIVFLLVGSVVFMYIEIDYELAGRESLQDLKRRVIGVVSGLENDSRVQVTEVVQEMSDNCKHDFLQLEDDEPLTWSLWNSFFFTFTVITTIGFGHMSPATQWGKIFCILYATVGVPLNGILIASLADIFSTKVVNSRVRARSKRYEESWVAVAADVALYLLPGFLIFLVLPAAVLVAAEEGWDYLDSFYYAFITLTTIGFGDYVAGRQETDYVVVWLYKIISFVWIIFGLGYIIMTITFIQNALKSKKIHNIERRLAKGLKKHTNKMNENVHRDLKRLRAVVNTLSVLRVENPYHEAERHAVETSMKHSLSQLAQQPHIQRQSVPGDNRIFLSHHHTPAQTPRHEQLKMKRSASDVGLGMSVKTENVIHSNSLGDINMFLDMVESLLREHEAEAVKRADDEAHHIVQEAVNSTVSLDSNSDKDASNTDLKDLEPKDVESGFINEGFLDDENKIVYNFDNDKAPKQKTDGDDNANERLNRKLSTFFGVTDFQSSSSSSDPPPAEAASSRKVKTVGDLLGMMENFIHHPTHKNQQKSFSKLKFVRQLSSSVPGHYRSSPESGRPGLSDIFPDEPIVDSNLDSPSSNQDTITSSSGFCRRRWSFCDTSVHARRFSHQSSDNGDEEMYRASKDTKGTTFKLMPKWIHSDSEAENNKEPEESTPDYTRL